MVGTVGVVLIFKILELVALLNEVMVLEPEWFTVPPALLVIPEMVPDPLILIVPVLVKLLSIVVMVPVPDLLMVPLFASVVIEQPPARVKFRIPEEPLVSVPAPVRRVPTVNAALLV
jgi:hypothetical protein